MLRFIYNFGVFCLKLIVLSSIIPFAILAFPLSWIAIALVAISYAFWIGFWLYSVQGRFYRLLKSQKSRLAAIMRHGHRRRNQISNDCDQRNMADLLKIVNATLNDRRNEIPIHLLVRVRIMLRECKKELDFSKALHLYQIVAHVEPALLNAALDERKTLDNILGN